SLAVELLLTDDPARAGQLAAELCSLNLLRQTLENETCLEALEMLRDRADDSAIVLASEQWRPGVIGIVASRLVERFDAPVFLICLDKGKGRGSARSARGVRLVDALTQCADLLGNYGGHDMAAGFTIMPDDIELFRQRVRDYIDRHMAPREEQTLCVDAAVPPALFTHRRVTSLQSMEPFGPGNPQPVFMLEGVTLTKAAPVGGGRHMRLSFLAEGMAFAGIFFGVDAISLGLVEGDCVDIAFSPEINTFANRSRVQFNLCDMRLSSPARELEAESLTLYRRFRAGDGDLSPAERRALSPSRSHLGAVWRYCARMAVPHHLTGHVTGHVGALSRKISREAGFPLAPGQLRAALDIFAELGLLGQTVDGETVTIEPVAEPDKVDLEDSETYRNLRVLTVR
ncbi:MAG: DHH family phosphoesterase, partial [Oscillospiraceae bacterium]|nr:DHH family phosphoesterase [Oscillospiraceae bacterium]